MIDGEAVFNVLNDWLDLDQDTFQAMWPELAQAFTDYQEESR